jgi:hypothetical protein
MWRELAAELGLATTSRASQQDVRAAEGACGCALPDTLRALLSETDGLAGEYGEEVVLSAARIAAENTAMRTHADFPELYMPFAPLLFFGAEGNGDLFAFRILSGGADELNVYVWQHEDDSRTATSGSLERYLRGERWHQD